MKKLIGLFMLLLIFSNTVSFICTLESSLAKFTEETFQNLTFKENETKNIEDYLYRVLQERNKSAQWKHVSDPPKQSLNGYDSRGDWWNFNDTSQWRDSVYVNGDKIRLIVGVKRDKPTDFVALENIVAKHKATIVNTISIKGEIVAVVVELPLNSVSAFVEETRSIELTSYIEPNMKVQAQFIPNDPYWGWQWGPQKVEADWAWNTTVGSHDVVVAVVDTGIYYYHEDLAANYAALGYDWVNMDNDPLDDHGHGTHCAGIIAAVLNNNIGVAGLAQVRVMAEKVLTSDGWGYWDWVANGIIHAADSGARIISMSLGGYGYSELVHEAVKYAYEQGVLIIAAAGNDNTNTKLYPAGYEEVIAVAATDQYDQKAWFSNWGDWIELAAPGVSIYSTVILGYESWSGTSMACPHISGVAALVWSIYPNKTRDWVRLWLRYTADDLGDLGFDVYYGYGRINARKAVEQTPPAHELIAYEWATPPYVKPGTIGIVNATVLNFGENDESGIIVQLIANGTIVDSALIDFLAYGGSATVSLAWTPMVGGFYNITLYVVPVPGETTIENNLLWKYIYVGFPVKAVVLHSAGNIVGEIITNWNVLNNEWYRFGDVMVYIDYTTLNKEDITYGDIASTEADVLIISCAFDPYVGWEFTDSEIEAITRYVYEGHGLIVTAGTFYYQVPNNNKLAPLFGLNEAITWYVTGTDLLHLLNTTHPLFTSVPNPLVFPRVGTALPSDGQWDQNELVDGEYLALGHFRESAIVARRGLVYISPWLEIIPPYYHHHLQLLYNAITWSRYQKPEHELLVSLEAPKHLQPGESALLNATVSNVGLNNETSVELYLLIDDTVVRYEVIPNMGIGESYTINYLWTPTIEKVYNITAYAPPLPNEELELNNIVTKKVRVMLPIKVAVLGDYYSQLTNLLRENGIITQERGWDVITDIHKYDAVIINNPYDPGPTTFLTLLEAADEYRVGLVFTSSWPGSYAPYGISLLQWYLNDPTGQGHGWGQGHVYYQILKEHPIFEGWKVGDTLYIITGGDCDHAWFWGYSGETIANIGVDYGGVRGGGVAYKIRESGNKHLLLAGLAPQGWTNTAHWTDKAKLLFVQGVLWASKPVVYEHDLAVSLVAPTSLELGNSVVISSTVRNKGLNSETNVNFCLLIDGEVVFSEVISLLSVGESYTVTYLWVPENTGFYNITAYVHPVPDEERLDNNIATKIVGVWYYTRLYYLHEWIGAGVSMGWHADDASWQYTLPFDFPFYGVYYRTLYVSSNGLITFLAPDTSYSNSIPALAGKLAIAPAWDDWVTYEPYDIYIWANSTHVGIRWYVRQYGSSIVANFEVILDMYGVIKLNYSYNDGLVSATVGISNGAGHILVEDLTNLNCINSIVFVPYRVEHDLAVLSVECSSYEVTAGDTIDVAVTVENQGTVTEDFWVTAYASPYGLTVLYTSHSSLPRIYLDPSNYVFNTDTVSVGARFNVTVRLDDVQDLAGWQVRIYYNDSIINITRWIEPRWDPEYVYYGLETIELHGYGHVMGEGFAWMAAAAIGPFSFSGSGKLCIFEFEVTAVPPLGETYSCALRINHDDTELANSEYGLIPAVKEDGYYELGSTSVPIPSTYVIGTVRVTDLAPGENRTIIFTWNTTNVVPWDYQIYAKIAKVPGETDITDNICYDGVVTVLSPIVQDVAVTEISVSQNIVYRGRNLNINVTVANLGGATETFTVRLYYDEFLIDTHVVQSLEPNATLTLSFVCGTSDVAYGNYALKAVASKIPGELNLDNNECSYRWVIITIIGDMNGDGYVGLGDLVLLAKAYASRPGDPNWNPLADLAQPYGVIGLTDLVTLASYYGQTIP